jgi:signal transduction histidine kinase
METIDTIAQDCTEAPRTAPVEWQQVLAVLESPTARALRFDQFFLFELDREREGPSLLVLRAETNGSAPEAPISIDGRSLTALHQPRPLHLSPEDEPESRDLGPLAEFLRRRGGASALLAPVRQEGRLWGFLVGTCARRRDFQAGVLSQFFLLAALVALTVENGRLRAEMAFRFSEAMSLETVSSALVEGQSLDAILAVIIDEAMQLLGAKDALVLLLEEGDHWFRVCARAGPGLTGLTSSRMSVRDSLNGLVVATGEPLVSNDALTDPRANRARASRLNVHSVAIAPLKIRNRTIGTIAVHNKRDGYFSGTDVAILCSFANQAAVAIDNAQLFGELLRARDELQRKAEELRELLVETISIQEQERHRIAADIHDRVVSRIVGALYELETCIQLDGQSEPLQAKLQLLEHLLNEAVDKTRTSIYNLWPAILDHMGLVSALRELVSQDGERTGIQHSLRVYGKPYGLRPEAKIAAYRIVQEALSNIHQHAAAESVSISIRYSPQQVRIAIHDNGQGFDIERVMLSPPGHHFGLIGMRERALSVGGQLRLESEPGQGSQVIVDIPASNAELEVEGA